jgi:hypothetical protein
MAFPSLNFENFPLGLTPPDTPNFQRSYYAILLQLNHVIRTPTPQQFLERAQLVMGNY